MAGAMLRLKPHEQARLDELALKMNRKRLDRKQKPLMDTTILHELLDIALDGVETTAEGNLYYRKLGNNVLKAIFGQNSVIAWPTRHTSIRTISDRNNFLPA